MLKNTQNKKYISMNQNKQTKKGPTKGYYYRKLKTIKKTKNKSNKELEGESYRHWGNEAKSMEKHTIFAVSRD